MNGEPFIHIGGFSNHRTSPEIIDLFSQVGTTAGRDVLADGDLAAVVTLCPNLSEQLGRVGTSCSVSLLDVGLEAGGGLWTAVAGGGQEVVEADVRVATYGLAVEAEITADGAGGVAEKSPAHDGA